MSIGAISTATPAPVRIAGQTPAAPATESAKTAAQATTGTAASAATDATKEANETAAQTAQEASHGDHQAQKLVLKHQHHATTSHAATAPTAVANGSGQPVGEIINTKA